MINGNGSAALGLSYSLTDGNAFGEASLGLDCSGVGCVGILGSGFAEIELAAIKSGGNMGYGSASMGLNYSGAGHAGILGTGFADVSLAASPVCMITIMGSGSAEMGLMSWGLGVLQSVIADAGYQAYVVNTKTHGPALYTNFPFNSLFKFRGHYLGCSAQGIVKLTGKTDHGADIRARIHSGVSDYNVSTLKRYPAARVTCRNEGTMKLTIIVDETKVNDYTISAKEGKQGIHAKDVKLAKGVRGHSVEWELQNVDGSRFDLQMLEMFPEYLGRSR